MELGVIKFLPKYQNQETNTVFHTSQHYANAPSELY